MKSTSIASLGCGCLIFATLYLGCNNGAEPAGGTGGASGISGTGGSGQDAGAATGGNSSSGGVTASGGSPGTGGGSSTGGAAATGGKPSDGGTTGSGGSATGGSASGGSSGGGSSGGGGRAGSGGSASGGQGGSVTPEGGSSSGGSTGNGGASPGGTLPPVYEVENTGADCAKPTDPAFSGLKAVANLPDPLLMDSGTRITSRAEWRCRRAEISSHIQHWETGTKPEPPSSLTATYASNKLSVNVSANGNSVTLTATITLPSSGTAPYPVLIQMDGSGVPANIFTSRGVATMSFTSSQLAAQQPTRGSGTFWKLFPDNTAGAFIGWAWGVSRLIDGLQKTADQNKIDTKRIAVTGCSYAGKMALYAGAFDERIALVIPEESGGGGEAAWRVSASKTGTEDLEHAQGTGWYSASLQQFKNADAPKLPFDQHELAAMVAPRAILTIGNSGIDYLSSEAGYVAMKAASELYKALGISDRIGFSISGNHAHCSFPSEQTNDVAAFVDRFLGGKAAANTAVATSPYKTDLSKWITWDAPALK
jgi:hypothetical protein